MLHPKAVDEFLDQRCDDWLWIKQLSDRELDAALADQDFRQASPRPLRTHQKACILLLLGYPHLGVWVDMGCGKTRIILEVLQHLWRKGKLHRALILAISDEAIMEWENQIALWDITIPFVGVGNSATAEKWQAVAELGAGLIICTYPGFNWMFCERTKIKKDKKEGKQQLKPNNRRIDAFANNLQAMVWDESVHVGNHQSLGWRISKRLSQKCLLRIPMAGVPFGREPQLVWAQQYLADRGASLGETLGVFRAAFYKESPGYWTQYEYKFRKETEPELRRCMAHRSITYSADECLDLPSVTPILRKIRLPESAAAYFQSALKQIRLARGDRARINNIFLRMRQLSSGFVGYKDDETGERAELVFDTNPKLDDLLHNIEDMPDNRKFVIFHEFTWSGRTVSAALTKMGIKHGWLWSGTENVRELRKRFDEEPPHKMKGFVVNWRLGAESLNLQAANYLHFFETPVSVIMRKQAEKRTFRDGQLYKGFMYDYVATPADRRVLDFYKSGANLFNALLRDPYTLLSQ